MIPQRPDTHLPDLIRTQHNKFHRKGETSMKKIAFIALAAALTSLGATADTIVTSKTYVDTTRQAKITPATTGSVATYNGQDTNGGAVFSSKAVFSSTTVGDYNSTNNAGDIPTMGAVMAQINNSTSGILPTGTQNQILQHNGTTWVAETMDATPTASSNNPVTSGGVKTYVDGKVSSAATVSSSSTTTAPNEKAVYDAINTVQTQVTNLAACKHTCASSDGTAVCDLITINCVEPAPAGNQN